MLIMFGFISFIYKLYNLIMRNHDIKQSIIFLKNFILLNYMKS